MGKTLGTDRLSIVPSEGAGKAFYQFAEVGFYAPGDRKKIS